MSLHSITINSVPIEWNLEKGELRFFGTPSTLFWNDPSVLRMLQPIALEIGIPLFKLLVAHSSSLGTDENYRRMITDVSDNFDDGFSKWGDAVSAAGWGVFELNSIDYENKTARVTITNPWELVMQQSFSLQEQRWGCPFMLGKIIGIFSQAFGVRVWANENSMISELKVEFSIYPSDRTIEDEIDILRQQRMNEDNKRLNDLVALKTIQLQQAQSELTKYANGLEKMVDERTHRLNMLSITDELTGLSNRRHFNKVFQAEINRAMRDKKYLTLLLFDIDYFKDYNDTYGHIEGDKVLERIGKLLSSLSQRAGDFVFRVGGEEFVYLTSSPNINDNKDIAKKILRSIKDLGIPHIKSAEHHVITVSMGEVIFKPTKSTTVEKVYVAGDEAMYKAKSDGKNKIVTVYL